MIITRAARKSSLSQDTSCQALTNLSVVSRHSRPGERTAYYRVEDEAWERLVRQRIAGLASFCEITSAGMDLVGRESPRASRIRAAHETFDWMARIFADAPPMPSRKRPRS